MNNGETGSITFIGTVSPAGGNLKEPVTESTRKAARCFYALSQKRADSKRYPAVDPLDSYSKYIEYPEFVEFADSNIEKGWSEKVIKAKDIARKGQEANDQISILGDDAVPLEYHQRLWTVAVRADEVPQHILDQELEIAKDKARQAGKPENLLDRIAQGSLQKYFKENTLLQQEFIKDAKINIEQYLHSANKELTVISFKRFTLNAD